MPIVSRESLTHGTSDLPLSVHFTSHSDINHFMIYPHWHNEFEFVLQTCGNMALNINGNDFRLSAGQSAFINSGSIHSAVNAEETEKCEFIAVVFSPSIFSEITEYTYQKKVFPIISGEQRFPPLFSEAIEWQCSVISLLQELVHCYIDGSHDDIYNFSSLNENTLEIKSILFRIWCICIRSTIDKTAEEKQPVGSRIAPVYLEYVRTGIDYIHSNYRDRIRLSQLSEITHICEAHFSRIFKLVTGLTVSEYINNYRIIQICRQLTAGSESISETAYSNGFDNLGLFNRIFKRNTNMTPTEFVRLTKRTQTQTSQEFIY